MAEMDLPGWAERRGFESCITRRYLFCRVDGVSVSCTKISQLQQQRKCINGRTCETKLKKTQLKTARRSRHPAMASSSSDRNAGSCRTVPQTQPQQACRICHWLEITLDLEFMLLSSASYVDLSDNMMLSSDSGKFLPQISESIKYMNLSHNQLTGSLVGGAELPVFQNLKVLDLSYNQLNGELPGFDFVYDLQILKLSNNRFSGFIPSGLLKGDSLVLTELDLSTIQPGP